MSEAAAAGTSDGLQRLADDVDAAAHRLRSVVTQTPLERSSRLSNLVNGEVLLKREDLQSVRSYKIRGAYNAMLQLGQQDRESGVVCASAGNHAQGFAQACARLQLSGRIFVPRRTPRQKIEQIKSFGGDAVELIIGGDTFDEASAAATEYAEATGAVLIHPFDAPATIAGQGTVAKEIHAQLGDAPDIVVVPVGGGGLLAGIAAYFAQHAPQTRVVGVEPAGAASMTAALSAGDPVTLDQVDSFVDGAAVRRAGALPFEVIRALGTEVTSVAEGRTCTEMLSLYQVEGIIAEPAGALAASAIGSPGSAAPVQVEPGTSVVCLVSGGNNDIARYSEVVERSLIHEGLKHYFIVTFPQQPGALRSFLDDVLGPDDDITLFEYVKRSARDTGPAFVGITLGSAEDLPGLLQRMADSPIHIESVPPESALFRLFV